MTGADLRCPECGAGARDVASDCRLDPPSMEECAASGELWMPDAWRAVSWTCANGHWHITGTYNKTGTAETMAYGARP